MTKEEVNVEGQDGAVEFNNIFDSITNDKAEAENLKIESDRLIENQEELHEDLMGKLEEQELNQIIDSF